METSQASEPKSVWDLLSDNNPLKVAERHPDVALAITTRLDGLAAAVFEMMDKNGFWDQTKPVKMLENIMASYLPGQETTQEEYEGISEGVVQAIKRLEPEIKLAKHMLVITEVAECSEGVRKPGPSDHIPEFTLEEEEMVDALVRLLDYCGKYNLRLGACFLAKMRFNGTRPYKHGKAA